MVIRGRQHCLLEHVNNAGIESVQDLAKLFNVSEMTIRRDIEHLSESGLLVKVKGGAQQLPESTKLHEAHLRVRIKHDIPVKQLLAEKAIEFIEPGDILFLDGSTTIICLAKVLAKSNMELTVVTNSVLVALELSEAKNIRLMSMGGIFDHETFSFCPMESNSTPMAYHVKKMFLSCTGFVVNEGTYENSIFNMAIEQKMAQTTEKVHLLVDSTKLGKRALNRVLGTDQIDVLITENVLDRGQVTSLEAMGIKTFLVADNDERAHRFKVVAGDKK